MSPSLKTLPLTYAPTDAVYRRLLLCNFFISELLCDQRHVAVKTAVIGAINKRDMRICVVIFNRWCLVSPYGGSTT